MMMFVMRPYRPTMPAITTGREQRIIKSGRMTLMLMMPRPALAVP